MTTYALNSAFIEKLKIGDFAVLEDILLFSEKSPVTFLLISNFF